MEMPISKACEFLAEGLDGVIKNLENYDGVGHITSSWCLTNEYPHCTIDLACARQLKMVLELAGKTIENAGETIDRGNKIIDSLRADLAELKEANEYCKCGHVDGYCRCGRQIGAYVKHPGKHKKAVICDYCEVCYK